MERTRRTNPPQQPREAETDDPDSGSPVLEAVLENARNRRSLGTRLAVIDDRLATDELVDIVRHAPVLQILLDDPRDRREIEAALDVSRPTSHRFVRWLDEHGYAEKRDGRYRLTGPGEAVAEETLRFEANVSTTHRLAPLLARICDDHEEFVVEPFVDATVTEATPADPLRPVRRFVDMVENSDRVRGFNATHIAPLSFESLHERLVEDPETEFIPLRDAAQTLVESYPALARQAMERGDLALRTRDALPYRLVLFDHHVALAGFDEETGAMAVLVDTDSPIAREWGEQVYAAVRADSDPFDAPEQGT